MGNPIWFLFWLLVLIIISFYVAAIACFFYIIIFTLTVCIPPLSGTSEFLLQGVQFPHYCAKAMMECRSIM